MKISPYALPGLKHHYKFKEVEKSSIEVIEREVCKHFAIPINIVRSKKRNRNIVLARHIAMFLSRKLTTLSLDTIGKYYGGRDHTTVIHATKTIQDQIDVHEDTKDLVAYLSTKVL